MQKGLRKIDPASAGSLFGRKHLTERYYPGGQRIFLCSQRMQDNSNRPLNSAGSWTRPDSEAL
jgi:hypothetical protein